MYETVSVDEALKRGRRMINTPVLFILLGALCSSVFLPSLFHLPGYFIGIGLPISFVIAWLYWSVMITRWRIWAFENVRNVHELKKLAVKEKLIWKDGSIFEKTEIRTAAENRKWLALQYKFNQPDVFIEDHTVAAETEIHFSKNKALGEVVLGAAMMLGSIYFFNQADTPILAWVLIGFGLFLVISGIRKYQNRKARITISNQGIQTLKVPFAGWGEITNEDVIEKQSGKTVHYYFVYDAPTGSAKVDIGDLDIDRHKLQSLLTLYRSRYNNSMVRHQ